MSTVTEYLTDRKIEFRAFDHRRAETAVGEAKALGVAPGEVAKTIVLDADGQHVLAVVPASRRLDLNLAAEAIGEKRLSLASEAEIAHDFPGFELGAIPPLGGLLDVPIYVDTDLAGHDSVVFASGWQTESVKVRTADLLADPRVTVAPLCRYPETYDRDWME